MGMETLTWTDIWYMLAQVQRRRADHPVNMVAKHRYEPRRFQVYLELPRRSTGESVGRLALWVRGDSPVATARARALDILGVHDLDAYLTVDGKVVEGEGQELVVVAGGGSRVTVQQRVRGGAARAALPRPPGTTSSGAEAAVALEPRERPREVPTMIFQDPLDTRLASQLKTLVGAAKAHIDDFVGVVAGLLFKVERVEESLRGDAAALRDQAGKVIQDM